MNHLFFHNSFNLNRHYAVNLHLLHLRYRHLDIFYHLSRHLNPHHHLHWNLHNFYRRLHKRERILGRLVLSIDDFHCRIVVSQYFVELFPCRREGIFNAFINLCTDLVTDRPPYARLLSIYFCIFQAPIDDIERVEGCLLGKRMTDKFANFF